VGGIASREKQLAVHVDQTLRARAGGSRIDVLDQEGAGRRAVGDPQLFVAGVVFSETMTLQFLEVEVLRAFVVKSGRGAVKLRRRRLLVVVVDAQERAAAIAADTAGDDARVAVRP
jgi:hypothetical protein